MSSVKIKFISDNLSFFIDTLNANNSNVFDSSFSICQETINNDRLHY